MRLDKVEDRLSELVEDRLSELEDKAEEYIYLQLQTDINVKITHKKLLYKHMKENFQKV